LLAYSAMEKKVKKQINVVVIGGGTGTSTVLRGLSDKKYRLKLSAIITTSDTGGSSGKLTKKFGIIPPGDIRQNFIALSVAEYPQYEEFNARDKDGHARGNIFFASEAMKYGGDLAKAVEVKMKSLKLQHSVIPVTLGATNLIAHLDDNTHVEGEHHIIKTKNLNKRLARLELEQEHTSTSPKALEAISDADFIIIGPGNLYVSLTPPFLAKGIKEALLTSKAKKIYIANLMNQFELTDGFKLSDYINHLYKYLDGKDIFEYILYNTKSISSNDITKHKIPDKQLIVEEGEDETRFIGADLLAPKLHDQDPNDPIKRTLIRHDSQKIAVLLAGIMNV